MKIIKLLPLLTAAALVLNACSTTDELTGPLKVHLTPQVSCDLPQLALKKPLLSQQLLTVSYNGQSQEIIALLEGQGTALKLSILSVMGIRVYDAEFKDGVLTAVNYLNIKELPPAPQVLFDIMLCEADAASVNAVLPDGWTITDAGRVRTLTDDAGAEIYRLDFDEHGAARRLVQRVFNYEIAFSDLK